MNRMQLLLTISAIWVASEIVITIVKRSKSGEADQRDKKSLRVVMLCFSVGPFLAGTLTSVRATHFHEPFATYAYFAGLSLIVIGCVIRWIAIATLKRYFTVDVAIARDHKVIQHGLYSVVRHPSYTGTLLSFIGLGLGMQNWLSLAVLILATIIGLGYRISVEEEALVAALGDEYRVYAARTKRLIPGIF